MFACLLVCLFNSLSLRGISLSHSIDFFLLCSIPCPRGDECPAGENCFNGSPCALINGQEESDNVIDPSSNPTQLQPEGTATNNNVPVTPAKTMQPTLLTPSPSILPTTSSPSKAPIINTNFCGTSWEDHTKDCASSTPCPRGDECASDESCFTGSPCSSSSTVLSGQEGEHVAGSYCGTEWNLLMTSVS